MSKHRTTVALNYLDDFVASCTCGWTGVGHFTKWEAAGEGDRHIADSMERAAAAPLVEPCPLSGIGAHVCDLEEELDGQLVVAVPGRPVGSLDLRPTLF